MVPKKPTKEYVQEQAVRGMVQACIREIMCKHPYLTFRDLIVALESAANALRNTAMGHPVVVRKAE